MVGIVIQPCQMLGSANWVVQEAAKAWGSGMFMSASVF
jgi:hypothetical protein